MILNHYKVHCLKRYHVYGPIEVCQRKGYDVISKSKLDAFRIVQEEFGPNIKVLSFELIEEDVNGYRKNR